MRFINRIKLLFFRRRVINTLPQKPCGIRGKEEQPMITQQEINSIDRNYFTVITAGCYGVTLQSKNTKHCWYVACEDLGYMQTFRIDHTPMKEHPCTSTGTAKHFSPASGRLKAMTSTS